MKAPRNLQVRDLEQKYPAETFVLRSFRQIFFPPFSARELATLIGLESFDENPIAWNLPGGNALQQKLLQFFGADVRASRDGGDDEFGPP